MDFDDIGNVVPWFETAHVIQIDLDAPQVAEPRAFKSHLPWDQVPKGGRYIYVIRDPKDALLSFYHFFDGWLVEPDTISVESFAFDFYFVSPPFGLYWEHLQSWWAQRHQDNCCLVTFEDLKRDLPAVVRRIAAFMEISLDATMLDLVVAQASFAFMRERTHQFDESPLRNTMDTMLGLPPGTQTPKIRTGIVGGHQHEIPSSVSAAMDELWAQKIAKPLGFRSYEELCVELAIS